MFITLGEQPDNEIAQKLREIGDDEAARFYETRADGRLSNDESLFKPRMWLNTSHQYGFIPPFKLGTQRFHNILSANNIDGDISLKNKRINMRLQRLHIHEYPISIPLVLSQIAFGTNIHTVLFTFEAYNQVTHGAEPVAFNQIYEVASGQDAGVAGHPIFIGLKVGGNGVAFSCRTVNVGSSNDKKLVNAINSDAMKSGLSLLTTAQPALAPFVNIAKGLATSLADRSMNVGVQNFTLGLDFETGALGARLAVGSYVIVQVPCPDTLVWSEWHYDVETETIIRKYLAEGEEKYAVPYNMIILRISEYQN